MYTGQNKNMTILENKREHCILNVLLLNALGFIAYISCWVNSIPLLWVRKQAVP